MQASKQVEIVPGNVKETLKRCNGFYECPKDTNGKRLGPLVGYAGKYEVNGEQRQYIGDVFANFAMAEEFPHVLTYFAEDLAAKATKLVGEVDYVLAAPMGGLALGAYLAKALDTRYVFAEKKVVSLATKDLRQQEALELLRHQIDPGSRVLLVEDVCNNFSTTGQMMDLVSGQGSSIVAVACALNRSGKTSFEHGGVTIPAIALLELTLAQYRQDDPEVAADVQAGNIVLKPKLDWQRLMAAMENA